VTKSISHIASISTTTIDASGIMKFNHLKNDHPETNPQPIEPAAISTSNSIQTQPQPQPTSTNRGFDVLSQFAAISTMFQKNDSNSNYPEKIETINELNETQDHSPVPQINNSIPQIRPPQLPQSNQNDLFRNGFFRNEEPPKQLPQPSNYSQFPHFNQLSTSQRPLNLNSNPLPSFNFSSVNDLLNFSTNVNSIPNPSSNSNLNLNSNPNPNPSPSSVSNINSLLNQNENPIPSLNSNSNSNSSPQSQNPSPKSSNSIQSILQ